jgi:histidyl-tRNA synthetase
MFRYERPQAFRYRQFYQIGAEALGVDDPKLDAELISMLATILKNIGLKEFNFEITSIGCKKCRSAYRDALKKHLQDKIDNFCRDCQRRYNFNPLRILDCKVDSCIKERKDSPAVIDFLCKNCKDHFEKVRYYLELLQIPYIINPNLVRGLDYYTKTAFEVTSKSLGSQNAVAAGGRYDGLVDEFGGPSTPGIGFAIGMERVIPLIKDSVTTHEGPDLFFCSMGHEASERSFVLAEQLRTKGLWIEINYDNSSLRSQMRKANRIGAKNVVIIGEDELKKGKVTVRDMSTGKERVCALEIQELLNTILSKS